MRTPELARIAEAMVEGEWLDLRVVELGMVGRALPLNITVWPDRDEVLLRQEFVLSGDRTGDKELKIDAEDIMWLRTSVLSLEDVIPPVMPDPPKESHWRKDSDGLASAIQETVAAHLGIPLTELLHDRSPHGRKLCIRLMWELSPLGQYKIPPYFGYRSGGMSTHALDWTQAKQVDTIRQLHRELERRYGHQLKPCDRHGYSPHRQQLLNV